jgi:hypothetical protein
MVLLCCIGQVSPDAGSPDIRIGISFTASFPMMEDEKDFAEMVNQGGMDFDLASTAWGGTVEVLGDVGERFRLRGGLSVSRLHGSYSEGYDPLTYIFVGIFTAGLGFMFSQSDEVVDLDDEAVSIEAEAYYLFHRTPDLSLSVGAGPVFTFASRHLDTPNTTTKGSGSGLGMVASLRLDQESEVKLICLPLLFGLEAGYRLDTVELDDTEAEGFQLDFSGPFVKAGSYIGL